MAKINMFGTGFTLQAAIWAACGMAFILFGYDQGVFSGIVENEDFLDTMHHPGDSLMGIIVSIYNLGCFTGCIVNFVVAEWLGRRRAMWVAMIWIIIGASLQTSAFSVAHLMVGRFVTGIGTGIETSTVPMYQAELCEASKRGKLVCSEPLLVGVGIVISYFFDYGMSFVGGQIAWRLPIACQMIFAFVVIILVFGLPESPRYCYKEQRNDEALQILSDVNGLPKDDPKIVAEQEEILEALELETKHGVYKWRNIFRRDEVSTGHRVLLAYSMQFMNQVGGINLVVYFIPTVLNSNVGLSKNLSLIIGGCVQVMFVIGSFFPTFFVDRVGRRVPMMWGSFGLGLCMMMVSILLSFKGKANEHATSSASVAFFFLYMLIFGASVNCIPWVYVPEILPLHARAKGTAVGISSNWIWNFFVVMITPIIINRLQWKAYLIFMCTNFAFVPLVYFCYPETANLTLEEIDYLFTNPEKTAVRISNELHKERKKHGHTRLAHINARGHNSSVIEDTQEKAPGIQAPGEHVENV
ncbi:putative MFS sugar transporter [Aspergillus fischeri NRRL 181]|uniref:Hexose carrier protein n=1 Tax=Neosartorya fischeri (strain ATCC 1020 / DSM 3700 / CBS 544.65 / FGSC A1164 / JCM 1740 / NRRL 181 / WB 181) TaxID=331117 RepID=A1CZ97_NEOFI|nr:hexose carrier protein [Aspergillus fischeri NRRL 181]EAW24067.1 hexose carrier protein [Aspergillus fischeri NRRL 181]